MSDVQLYRDLAAQFTRLADSLQKGDGLFSARIMLITDGLRLAGWEVSEEPCTNCTAPISRCYEARIKCCPDCTHGHLQRLRTQMLAEEVPS